MLYFLSTVSWYPPYYDPRGRYLIWTRRTGTKPFWPAMSFDPTWAIGSPPEPQKGPTE